MKKILKFVFNNLIYFPLFKIGSLIGIIFARFKLIRITTMYAQLNAIFAMAVRRVKKKDTVREIGEEWKRMFPLDSMQEITDVDSKTFYATTHVNCPLKNSGNVMACYRVMEFDRQLCKKIGGEFIILSSQAEPGVPNCKIAIRKLGESTNDLIHAHERYYSD